MRSRPSKVAFLSSVILLLGLVTPVIGEPLAPSGTAPAPAAALTSGQVRLRHIVSGLSTPLGVVNAGDGTNRLFVLEKRGTVRVIRGERMKSGFFLDLRGVAGGLSTSGERGLLGLAFHPSFETNEKLFVYYTNGGGDLVIAEFTANAPGTQVDLSTRDTLLTIEHSAFSNHNGGQLLFGPDGFLYAFTGDGGGGGDPFESGQNTNTLLAKTLRISPNLAGGYSNPASNPYTGPTPGLGEIWSIGLRNPWRASFDRATDALWIADVGQGSREEINREPANTPGRNYGWDCREGSQPFESSGCSGKTFTGPVAEYGHGAGDCSVTGGYVYRGDVFPDFRGRYVLGDFCTGRIWTLRAAAPSPSLQLHRDTSAMITSFGEAENGELFMTDYAGGHLYRVIAPPFSDVTTSKFLDDIMWLYNEGITSGCGQDRFCPQDDVTRAQMATFLTRALDLPPAGGDFFTDDEGNTHEANINRIAAADITTGCATNRFCPDNEVNRGAMATFLDRALDLPSTSQDFFDDDEGNMHEGAINRIAAAGITTGCGGGNYCPRAVVTRGQMAAFLHRALGE
jgi:glucose/arabinose dehydrogenase